MSEATAETDFDWPVVLGDLTRGRDIDRAVASSAMATILAGQATPAQIAGFIVALRMKGETVDELSGLLGAMRAASTLVPLDDVTAAVDTCGTGGDGSHSINVSTIAAMVIAGAGVPVCKHGNRSASSKCGSADVLESLGVELALSPEAVAACVREAGMGFCFAPAFHPAMRHAGPPRREMGIPTVFNVLGPLANPGRVRRQVVGVSDPAMADRMIAVLADQGATRAMVVHGSGGLDEFTTDGPSVVRELRGGAISTYEVDASALGLAPATVDDLRGGDAEQNAEAVRRVLAGTPGPHREVVLLNAAAGLLVADRAGDLSAGVAMAADSIDSGRAAQVLEMLIAVSQRESAGSD